MSGPLRARFFASRRAALLASIGGGLLLLLLFGRYEWREMELTPDSQGYHEIAVGLVEGEGFVATGRSPVYPLFLAAIYRLHGTNPDAVLPYQLLLTALTGASVVALGGMLLGAEGLLAGLVAVFLLGQNREAAYPTSQLLTECLAGFLLTAAALAAAWARRGGWKREVAPGVLMALAVLTRPGLVFVGLTYGSLLLLPLPRIRWRRAVGFGLPCAILLSAWSAHASLDSGRVILLAGNSGAGVVAGLAPDVAARYAGLESPAIDAPSLERFWRGYPGYRAGEPTRAEVVASVAERPRRFAKITLLKFVSAVDFLPESLWYCIALGFALVPAASVGLVPGSLLRLASALLLLVVLGWSHTLVMAFATALPFGVVGACLLPAVRARLPKADLPHLWWSSWFIGFLLMILVSFGIDRFMRPFMPVFYLSAVLAVPLLVRALLAAGASPVGDLPDGSRSAMAAPPEVR